MKRILFILLVVTASTTVMAGMSTSKVRKETRFLTDKMAYELDLSNPQYNDVYEINYDFIYSLRNIMDYVVRGDEWALDDYYEALDIRNDDLRWVLSDGQYRRFLGAVYFYRPIYVTGGRWNFRIYINYPNRSLFYFGVPYHYRTYCGAHYRPHIHHVSYYRGRYNNVVHYPTPYRVRDQRVFHSYRRSDFGSVRFRPNTSVRPHNAPARPGVSGRPGTSSRPNSSGRPWKFFPAPVRNRDIDLQIREDPLLRADPLQLNARRVQADQRLQADRLLLPETINRIRRQLRAEIITEVKEIIIPEGRPGTSTGSSNSDRRPTGGSTNRESGRGSSSFGSSSRTNGSTTSSRNHDSSNRGSSTSGRSSSSGSTSNRGSSSSGSSSSRGSVSRSTERSSSSGSTSSSSRGSSSRSSERGNSSRR